MQQVQVKIEDVCTLTLRRDWTWDVKMDDADDPRGRYYKGEADIIADQTTSSPALGEWGHHLAKLVAKRLGGVAILPPVSPAIEGVEY